MSHIVLIPPGLIIQNSLTSAPSGPKPQNRAGRAQPQRPFSLSLLSTNQFDICSITELVRKRTQKRGQVISRSHSKSASGPV